VWPGTAARSQRCPSPSLFSRGYLCHTVKIVLPQLAFAHQEFAAQFVKLHVERELRVSQRLFGRMRLDCLRGDTLQAGEPLYPSWFR
jgi:hypothetical protein